MFTDRGLCGIMGRSGRRSSSFTACRRLSIPKTPMSRDAIQSYLNEIGKYPLLTKAQEISLGTQIQRWLAIEDKDESEYTKEEKIIARTGRRAKEKFVNCNLRLVVNIAKKYVRHCKTLDLMDLIQEGNLGLVRAVEKFDPKRGYAMSTYAYWWIRQSIQRSLQSSDAAIRLPVNVSDSIYKIKRAKEEIFKQTGLEPTIQEISEKLSMSPDEIKSIVDVPIISASLDKAVGTRNETSAILDMISDENNQNTMEELEVRISIERAMMAIDTYLDDQARYVVLARQQTPPVPWRKLAQKTGVSKEKLQAIEKKSLAKCSLILSSRPEIAC